MSALTDAVWRQIEPGSYITRDDFDRGLDGWTIDPVEHNGALAFVIMTNGPEIHFISFGITSMSMRIIRKYVNPIIAQYGFVRTRTPKSAARQRRWNKALGFVEDGEDEFVVNFRMDEPGWRRKCQSS